MVLKNVACPECGNAVSFTIESIEEVSSIWSGPGIADYDEHCGNCGEKVHIDVVLE